MITQADLDLATKFRLALRGIASTVSIVTAKDGDRRYGMTVTSLTSLTMEPPALLVCLNRAASLVDAARVSQGFCVNILNQDHQEVSKAFSGGARGENRFMVGAWRDQESTGLPYLEDAQTVLFCRKTAAMPYGTHTILIGDVAEVAAGDLTSPLIYWNSGYATFEDRRSCVAS